MNNQVLMIQLLKMDVQSPNILKILLCLMLLIIHVIFMLFYIIVSMVKMIKMNIIMLSQNLEDLNIL